MRLLGTALNTEKCFVISLSSKSGPIGTRFSRNAALCRRTSTFAGLGRQVFTQRAASSSSPNGVKRVINPSQLSPPPPTPNAATHAPRSLDRPSTDKLTDPPIERPTDQQTYEAIDELIDRPTDKPTDYTDQPTNRLHRPTDQPTTQTNRLTDYTDRPTNRHIHKATDGHADRPQDQTHLQSVMPAQDRMLRHPGHVPLESLHALRHEVSAAAPGPLRWRQWRR